MTTSKVVVRFAIGRNVGKFDASSTTGAGLLTDAIAQQTSQVASARVRLSLKSLTTRLQATVASEYDDAVAFAINSMMGTQSRGVAPIEFHFIPGPYGGLTPRKVGRVYTGGGTKSLAWQPLAKSTLEKKAGGKLNKGNYTNASKFFVDTGSLRQELKRMALNMVKRTGVVKVAVTDKEDAAVTRKTTHYSAANIRISLMPNIYPSYLPGLKSGKLDDVDPTQRFEKRLGLSPSALAKLRGPQLPGQPDYHQRPLLQPVFTYWTLFKIPAKIAAALQKSVVDIRNTGLTDASISTGGSIGGAE